VKSIPSRKHYIVATACQWQTKTAANVEVCE
jgi:hypothetical protein